jgi:hypothetical protein
MRTELKWIYCFNPMVEEVLYPGICSNTAKETAGLKGSTSPAGDFVLATNGPSHGSAEGAAQESRGQAQTRRFSHSF